MLHLPFYWWSEYFEIDFDVYRDWHKCADMQLSIMTGVGWAAAVCQVIALLAK